MLADEDERKYRRMFQAGLEIRECKGECKMLDEIVTVVKKCGDIILFADGAERNVSSKEGRANFVTKYDVAVQAYLEEELLKILPEAVFIGEEGEHSKAIGEGYAFIVDPIDGTTNFIKNYHRSCVSVGLALHGTMEIGVVYNPYSNEMFYAQRGKGAFLNGQPLHVSSNRLEEGLVCFGTSPYYAELIDQTFDLVKTLHRASLDVRRSGSAALDLCDIASGRCELFFECRLSPWDYAAGSLIVQEAGGRISRMDGTEISLDKGCSVLAGGPAAWEDYFKMEGHMELA